jgi:alpha-D-ribose 1-methylphosphonate 5-triphosphate diphosphatase
MKAASSFGEQAMDDLTIINGRVLLADGTVAETALHLRDGHIAGFDGDMPGANNTIDAKGKYVLPGIVDIHGDAFERQIMPRPGVHFALDIALLDTDRQMLANGITTAFHGVTFSWEPGLRSRDNFVRIMDTVAALNGALKCDTRLHMRFETYNIDGADAVLEWTEQGRIGLLAFNNHTPEIYENTLNGTGLAKYAGRAGLSESAYAALVERVIARAGEVPAVVEKLASAAGRAGIQQLSHDDAEPEMRTYYNDLGCRVCEFPETEETARTARDYGNPIVMGAPNVVRGGSHNGSISAAEMIGKGLCTVLASDYYYPAPLHAAFRLHREGGMGLAESWSLVSRGPALATGLDDRGEIAEGRRADILIVDDHAGGPPTADISIVGGQPIGWL